MSSTGNGPDRLPNLDPLLGKEIDGRYAIVELIGSGGMGRVYRAHQKSAGRDVAIKVLAERINRDQAVVERFSQEAQIISRLRHPNTIRLFDVGQLPDGRLYLVTELLSGVSLRSVLKKGPVDSERAMRIASQICDALSEAHAKGIVHRDLKPANLMLETVGDQELVKVLDFGIAKLAGEGETTQSGLILGTPTYMSPEQALGRPVDFRSDIYSLGIILYYCLAGRPPFSPDTPHAVVYHHIHVPPPAFSDLPKPIAVPGRLEDLITEMLAKDPDLRPADTREVQRRLRSIMARQVGETTRQFEAGSDRTGAYPDRTEASMAPLAADAHAGRVDRRLGLGASILIMVITVVAFGVVGRAFLWPSPIEPPMARPPATPEAPAIRPMSTPDPPEISESVGLVRDVAVVVTSSPATAQASEAKAPAVDPAAPKSPPQRSRATRRRRPPVRRKRPSDAKRSSAQDPADETPQGFVDVFDDE